MADVEFFSAPEPTQAPHINLHLSRLYLCKELLAVCFYTLLAHCWPRNSIQAIAYQGHATLCEEQVGWRKRQLAGEDLGSAASHHTRFAR